MNEHISAKRSAIIESNKEAHSKREMLRRIDLEQKEIVFGGCDKVSKCASTVTEEKLNLRRGGT